MRQLSSCLALLLEAFVITASSVAAETPFVLLHSLFDPGTNVQVNAQQGYSVAVDGNLAVVGAPFDDVGTTDSGVAKVYDAATGSLLHSLTNPSPAAGEQFGYSVAISGTRVVVGAIEDDGGTRDEGSAYVYDLAGATPGLPILTLTNPSPAPEEAFGSAVAIAGTRVVIGAYLDRAGSSVGGIAYVYDLAQATPALPVVMLTNPSPASLDSFGYSVAIAGTRVVVGAYQDDTGGANAGSAYVYDLSSVTPTVPVVTLNNPTPGPQIGDFFGYAVAIAGTRVVVGAYGEDVPGAGNSGIAYVYDLSSATPAVPAVTLTNPGPAAAELFGAAVAISGTRVLVGAYQDNTGAGRAGTAYAYDLSTATPTQPVLTLTNPSPASLDYFGSAVALSGTRAVIGAYQDDTRAGNAGSAYAYDLAGATPALPVATLNHPSPASLDSFGSSVAISGTRMVVGAPGDDTGAAAAGRAYVYDLSGVMPTVPAIILNNPSPETGDSFGSAVAISGARVVVAASEDNTGATNAGSAYVYDLNSSTPTVPVATLNNPSPDMDDAFANSVAISGTRVVIGAWQDDTGEISAGSAYVYDLAGATPTVPIAILNNPSPGTNFNFGNSVAISGTRVVVGTRTVVGEGGTAYVYDLGRATPTAPLVTLTNPVNSFSAFGVVAVSGTWVVVADGFGIVFGYDLSGIAPTEPVVTLFDPTPGTDDGFGDSVALSGAQVVLGTGGSDRAYVYDLSQPTPTVPVGTLIDPDPARGDGFGTAVAVDGTSIIVGARGNDTVAANRGAAYLFRLRPRLRIVPGARGFASLSWTPTNASGFVLQSADRLAPANWLNAPSGAANPVTIPTTNAARFYPKFHG